MVSILDLNTGSSDSDEDDVTYVPIKSDIFNDCSQEDLNFSNDHISKKIKPNMMEPLVEQSTNNVWMRFLESVNTDSLDNKKVQRKQNGDTFLNVTQTSDTVSESKCEIVKSSMSGHSLKSDEKLKPDQNKKHAIFKNGEKVPSCCKRIDNKSNLDKNHFFSVSTTLPPTDLSLILGAISNKEKKQSVLEKSLLDWKKFKEQEGIGKDLEIFNKGRQGFIERQRFLERSDRRSFEKEKKIRLSRKEKK